MWLDGRDVTALGPAARCRTGIGRSHQVPLPFEKLTVFENVLTAACFGRNKRERRRGRRLRRGSRADATDRRSQPPRRDLVLDRKQLELAWALATEPRLLLLDEIAGGLTEGECADLVALIRAISATGVTIVWIEHIVHALMAVVSRLVVLNFGRLIARGGTSHRDGFRRRAGDLSRLARMSLLSTHGLNAFYGDFQAVYGIDLAFNVGETVAIIGANGGQGKSTLLKTLTGLLPARRDSVRFDGEPIGGRPAAEVPNSGSPCHRGRSESFCRR